MNKNISNHPQVWKASGTNINVIQHTDNRIIIHQAFTDIKLPLSQYISTYTPLQPNSSLRQLIDYLQQ